MPEETDITFSELDTLCDLDPLQLTKQNLDRLIAGMRAYRANALAKGGKASKFSDEAGVKIDVKKLSKGLGLKSSVEELKRRI